MANPEHLAILNQGVKAWNEWREKNSEILPDLSGAELRKFNLANANLRDTDLNGADLTEADLSMALLNRAGLIRSDLVRAKLTKAYLHAASLPWADLRDSDLDGADLRMANLCSAVLWDARLTETQFGMAMIGWTLFGNLDLSAASGLESVRHIGPSTIGIDTIYRLQGRIPEVFLRGCGVPDIFIESARSLISKPIQSYSCFISHSHEDQTFCDRLLADMRTNDVPTWYFPEDAKWGELVWDEIDRNIKNYDKLVGVCSEHSLTSEPVLREIERALDREDAEHKSILFPITIDSFIFEKWEHPRKADLGTKVIGDFRGWDKDAAKYHVALQKLLKSLKVEN